MPMIYRNLIGQNHCNSGLIGMSDAGSGKQVKESKSSERKNTQMSLIFHLIFLCSILLFYSCNNHEKYDFESSDEALNEYDNLYKTVRSQETCNAEQLASFINLWYECSDTVYKFIQKDPSFTAHAGLTMRFDSITDSIRTRLMELADNFTLSDVAYVKLHTSIYGQDKELDSLKRHATVFFSSLDSIPVYTGNIRDLLADYSEFLLSYKLHGVHSEDALLRFIRMEDFFFRSFLASIDECSALGMADITDMTANICDSIYKEASNGKIKADETITYMSMRTGRRLLLNAKVCHEKLKRGIVKDSQYANAYLWMMLQPYLSIDALAITMLTPEQIRLMTDMAKDYPAIISRLDSKHLIDRDVTTKIPNQLIRLYISTI